MRSAGIDQAPLSASWKHVAIVEETQQKWVCEEGRGYGGRWGGAASVGFSLTQARRGFPEHFEKSRRPEEGEGRATGLVGVFSGPGRWPLSRGIVYSSPCQGGVLLITGGETEAESSSGVTCPRAHR